MKLSIIIPVHNEEKTLTEVISKVHEVFRTEDYEVIVVNDGSTDNTPLVLSGIQDERMVVVSHERNHGKGKAIRSALAKARGEYIAIQDADLEYRPENLYELYKIALRENAVAYGKRPGIDGYFFNRIGNTLLSFISSILFLYKLSDVYTCYKVMPTSLLKSLDLKSDGFEIEAEITAKILKRKVHIKEVPICIRTNTAKTRDCMQVHTGITTLHMK